MSVARTEGFDACEIRQDTIRWTIERLVELEVVTVPVNEGHLSGESKRFGAQRVDVVGIGIPRTRVRKVLLVVEIWIRLPGDATNGSGATYPPHQCGATKCLQLIFFVIAIRSHVQRMLLRR